MRSQNVCKLNYILQIDRLKAEKYRKMNHAIYVQVALLEGYIYS